MLFIIFYKFPFFIFLYGIVPALAVIAINVYDWILCARLNAMQAPSVAKYIWIKDAVGFIYFNIDVFGSFPNSPPPSIRPPIS
jgi:hypothetical protein